MNFSFLGLGAVISACLFSAIAGAAFFQAHLDDPGFSSLAGSFIRVLANLFFILVPLLVGRRGTTGLLLAPTVHRSLWLWGFFGALTVTTYFAALQILGNAMTAFLNASSGVFIAALSPFIARQSTNLWVWLGIAGSVLGMYLLTGSAPSPASFLGAALAIASGFFGALAYLMVARTKSAYSTATVMMTWCVSAVAAHLLLFLLKPAPFPHKLSAWLFLIAAGAAASLAQHYTALAFQRAPAARVAALSYLAPVMSLGLDALFFGARLSLPASLGAVLILFFGALLPSVRKI